MNGIDEENVSAINFAKKRRIHLGSPYKKTKAYEAYLRNPPYLGHHETGHVIEFTGQRYEIAKFPSENVIDENGS